MAVAIVSHCLYAQGASAQLAVARGSFIYDAPAECPTKQQFVQAIVVRTRQLPQTGPEGYDGLSVRVVGTATGFEGTLRVAVRDGQPFERSLEDNHCGALVEALALLAAIELAPIVANPQNGDSLVATQTTTHRQTQAEPPVLAPDSRRDKDYDITLAGVAGLQRAPTPGALFSGGVHLSLRRRSRNQSVGLSIQYGQTGLLRFDGGDVRFRWLAARFFGCPLGLKRKSVRVAVCATTEVGLLRGEPERANKHQDRNGWWIAPGVGALVSFEQAGFLLDLFGGVMRPMQRDTFYFTPATTSDSPDIVNVPPKVGLSAEIRLGVAF